LDPLQNEGVKSREKKSQKKRNGKKKGRELAKKQSRIGNMLKRTR
jgi:hypothetical protein